MFGIISFIVFQINISFHPVSLIFFAAQLRRCGVAWGEGVGRRGEEKAGNGAEAEQEKHRTYTQGNKTERQQDSKTQAQGTQQRTQKQEQIQDSTEHRSTNGRQQTET